MMFCFVWEETFTCHWLIQYWDPGQNSNGSLDSPPPSAVDTDLWVVRSSCVNRWQCENRWTCKHAGTKGEHKHFPPSHLPRRWCVSDYVNKQMRPPPTEDGLDRVVSPGWRPLEFSPLSLDGEFGRLKFVHSGKAERTKLWSSQPVWCSLTSDNRTDGFDLYSFDD